MDDQKIRLPSRTLLDCSSNDQLCIVRTHQYEVIVVPVFLVGITIILLAIILWLRYRAWKSRKKPPEVGHLRQESQGVVNLGISLEELSMENVLRTKDSSLLALEIPWERIGQPLQLMGEGRFGPLYKTVLRGQDVIQEREIVVKQLKGSAEPSDVSHFLQRAEFQAWLGTHPHLVNIIGCCFEQKPFCMVMECVEPGSLLHFLWDCRREFLHDRNLMHGDVAARNVLIQNNFTTKLTGLEGACEMHLRGSFPMRRPTPLKWMAPERLLHLSATSKSDVWSFGILLYEMVTLGAPPFPEVPPSIILQHLQRGKIMKRPSSCKQNLYNIMKSCWTWKVSDRISLSELRKRLENGKKTADDRTVLQVPELVVPDLYEGVAGTEPIKMETDYTVL
uniref:Protein kinase domain-containing protein n=1 Tax=Pyxicephalus adspersus TaxID=30357 RepID=A0AAV2ZU16_PYXAD|nr:TPA: hypothetical protein GDO54_004405 [Pyxicephalus adspersus]